MALLWKHLFLLAIREVVKLLNNWVVAFNVNIVISYTKETLLWDCGSEKKLRVSDFSSKLFRTLFKSVIEIKKILYSNEWCGK